MCKKINNRKFGQRNADRKTAGRAGKFRSRRSRSMSEPMQTDRTERNLFSLQIENKPELTRVAVSLGRFNLSMRLIWGK